MEANKHLYNTSDYPKEHQLHSAANKKVLGKMKDDCAVRLIADCICLKPKMYGMHVNKISLSAFNSKRWVSDDGVRANAYGYNPPPLLP